MGGGRPVSAIRGWPPPVARTRHRWNTRKAEFRPGCGKRDSGACRKSPSLCSGTPSQQHLATRSRRTQEVYRRTDKVSHFQPWCSGARISPDGQYIAFQSYRSGSAEVWISDRSGSNPLQLTSFGGAEVGAPSWAPDGGRIVFDVRASGGPELYIANIRGGSSKVFSTGTANAAHPFWSADGQWIYFSTEPFEDIWKAPVKGGGAVVYRRRQGPFRTAGNCRWNTCIFWQVGQRP